MSEAELFLIRARLQGGILAKAARGELVVRLPVELVYDPAGDVVLDPDSGVRQVINHLFTTFWATGSASAVVKAFAGEALTFPARHLTGPPAEELYWGAAAPRPRAVRVAQRALRRCLLLRAAPAGYRPRRPQPHPGQAPRTVDHPDPRRPPGNINWAQFEANQDRLAANAAAHGRPAAVWARPENAPRCCKASSSAAGAANG
jgi:hypothetical protein